MSHQYLKLVKQYLEPKLQLEPNATQRLELLLLPMLEHILNSKRKDKICTIVGISAPQGAGKSTSGRLLSNTLKHLGFSAETLTIDDLYLTRKEQLELAKQNPSNIYLQERGYPGTHDLELGKKLLTSIHSVNRTRPLLFPTYDKSKHQGRGDRNPQSEWKTLPVKLDFILFDGWMLGFTPPENVLYKNKVDDIFKIIDQNLELYKNWWSHLDAFIHLNPVHIEYMVDWRVEAEEKMKAQGKPGLTSQQIKEYAATFLPAYDRYLSILVNRHGYWQQKSIPWLRLDIEKNRLPNTRFI